ncbi:MAG: hypothetical protein IKW48_02085 [Akkermansia sp.]|nr:hypothetical protein [Akkermansia sp.]
MKNIYIGLGGVGARVLCEIRKQIFTRRLEQMSTPHQENACLEAEFLSIDSSPDIWENQSMWEFRGRDFSLRPDEKCLLDTAGIDYKSPRVTPWLFSSDPEIAEAQRAALNSIDRLVPGSMQRRRYGRLLFAANVDKVQEAIVKTFSRAELNGYYNHHDNSCSQANGCGHAVHVFCTLGGGTGSGGIVDLISTLYMHHTSNINLHVFLSDERGVSPSADFGFIYANQYAALRDLDNLASTIFRPHDITDNQNGSQARERIRLAASPVRSIFISSNINGACHMVPLPEQIKRTASWVLSSNSICDGCADPVLRRVMMHHPQDYSRGEPDDLLNSFVARSYHFASIGAARWCAPVAELTDMLSTSIQVSAYRQMLYNNLQTGQGYVCEAGELSPQELSRYSISNLEQLESHLSCEVNSAWLEWITKDPEIQSLLQGKCGKDSLTRLQALFEQHFQEYVLTRTSDSRLSLSNCLNLPAVRSDSANCLSEHLIQSLTEEITKAWEAGEIGLMQVQQVIAYGERTAATCCVLLQQTCDALSDEGERITCITRRLAQRQVKWCIPASLFLSLIGKGKDFLKTHTDDLVSLYSAKTLCQYLSRIICELERFQGLLRDVSGVLNVPMAAMEYKLSELEERYQSFPLRRFIEAGERPTGDLELEYDLDYSDPALSSMCEFVRTNTDAKQGLSIIQCASFIRAIVSESRPNGSYISELFHGGATVDGRTDCLVGEKSRELACMMMRDSDRYNGSRIMDGIRSVTQNMSKADFRARLCKLIKSAALSFQADDRTKDFGEAYNQQYYCSAIVVTYPENLVVDGMMMSPYDIKGEVSGILNQDNDCVYVGASNDASQISVWRTERACPARIAQVVDYLYERYLAIPPRMRQLWVDIDEDATKLMCPLVFPDKAERELMHKGAMWFVRQMPKQFYTDESTGNIILRGGLFRDRVIFNNADAESLSVGIRFAFTVQQIVRSIHSAPDEEYITDDFRARYRSELEQLGIEDERKEFQRVIDAFIEKTLARIDLTTSDF